MPPFTPSCGTDSGGDRWINTDVTTYRWLVLGRRVVIHTPSRLRAMIEAQVEWSQNDG